MHDITLQTAHALLDNCPLALLLIADDGSICGFNRAFSTLLGDAADTLKNATHPDDLITPLLGPASVINWIMPDGDERWLAVSITAVAETSGLSARFYTDVTEKLRFKKERDSLQTRFAEESLKDGLLTSLLSRYGIQISLEPMVSRSRRYNAHLSIITMGIETDADRDKTLRKIVSLLSDQTRWADLVGCNAKQDFILVLQETTQDSALVLVDKLAAQIEHLNASADNRISARFGVTQCQKNDNAVSMLERAESALAEARSNESGISIAI
jgi:GGDEF domain-containing protein